MEPTPFELTPEQKGMLASLSRETGKPMATLLAAIAAALTILGYAGGEPRRPLPGLSATRQEELRSAMAALTMK